MVTPELEALAAKLGGYDRHPYDGTIWWWRVGPPNANQWLVWRPHEPAWMFTPNVRRYSPWQTYEELSVLLVTFALTGETGDDWLEDFSWRT